MQHDDLLSGYFKAIAEVLFISFPDACMGMPEGRASVPVPQRGHIASGIPTRARGNEKKTKFFPDI